MQRTRLRKIKYDPALRRHREDSAFASEVKRIAEAFGLNGARLADRLDIASATLKEHLLSTNPHDASKRADKYAKALLDRSDFEAYREPLAEYLWIALVASGAKHKGERYEALATKMPDGLRATLKELTPYLAPHAPKALWEALAGDRVRMLRNWPLLCDLYLQHVRQQVYPILEIVSATTPHPRDLFVELCRKHGFNVGPFIGNPSHVLAHVWQAISTEFDEEAQDRILGHVIAELKKSGKYDRVMKDVLEGAREEQQALVGSPSPQATKSKSKGGKP